MMLKRKVYEVGDTAIGCVLAVLTNATIKNEQPIADRVGATSIDLVSKLTE